MFLPILIGPNLPVFGPNLPIFWAKVPTFGPVLGKLVQKLEKIGAKIVKIVCQKGQFGLEFWAFLGDFLGIIGIFGVNVHFWAGGHGLGPKKLEKLTKNCPIWD